jgi:hypothetical protein
MNELTIYARPHYFRPVPVFVGGVMPGLTLAEIVEEVHRRGNVPLAMRQSAICMINGDIVPRDYWHRIRPKLAAHIVVSVGVHGGGDGGGKKNPMAMVLSLAVIVAAAYAAPLIAGGLGFTVGTTGFTIAKALAGGLISGIGMMAVNALFPTRPASLSAPQIQSYRDSPTYSIAGAQNEARPFAPVPVILGRHKVTPPLGAKPYTEIAGNDEYLRMLFIWGIGPLKIENIKIGDTPIGDYEDVDIETREGREDDDPITLIASQVLQDSIGVTLTNAIGWVQRTSKTNADELSVDISFPRGLVEYTTSGGRASYSVVVQVDYRLVGTTEWTCQGFFNVTDKFVGNLRKSMRWQVARGQYEVRLLRTTGDTDNDRIIDDVMWSVLRTFRNDHPVKAPVPLAMTAIRIRGSEQLQGVISDLNGTVTSYAPVWDGESWGGEAATQNPAALKRLALTGPGNARPRTAAQIDDDALGAFYDFCEANGYKFNMVRDFAASVWDTCADICSAARGAVNITDGRWGVIMDTADKPAVQHFTPRNSWGFSGNIDFVDAPHAWRVRFVDEDNAFNPDERIVYDDGYDENNATKFEGIDFPGITNRDLVWKFGRYHIAQARLRPQSYIFNADFEHLVCQRGDLILVSHDVPLWGSGSGRVKELVGDEEKTTGVVLDERVVMEAGKLYACRFRREDKSSFVASIVTQAGETDTLTFQAAVPVAQGPKVGDLAMFGEAERETAKLLVKAVRPGEDLTAQIECVDYAPAIYEADQGEIPAFNPNVTQPPDITKVAPARPVITTVESGTAALEQSASGIKARILVSLQAGIGTIRVAQNVVRYALQDSTDWRYVQQPAAQAVIALSDVIDGETYVIQARAVSIYGTPSAWTEALVETVIGQSEKPSNVQDFRINVINGIAYLSWAPNTEIDLSHYQIRWTKATSGATWGGSVVVIDREKSTSITTQALDGTYLIKAVDASGNESETAATVISSLVAIAGYNAVTSISQDNASWSGTGDGVVYNASLGGLVLDGANYEGTYELDDVADLGGIYPVLATAALNACGVNLVADLYDITDLYNFGDLYAVTEGQTSASLELATTGDNPGGSPTWSSWTTFLVGEYAKRAFKARLVLNRVDLSVTPVVSAASVTLDMKDRIVRFNQSVPLGGARIEFDPAFYVAPEIGLAISNGQEGDAYTIANKSADGFDINFTNGGSNVGPRSVMGTAVAYGELIT